MYSTCIYCRRTLGSNETIEHFPVGRRLAFDPAKGRLWVVCGSCGRWNLTPLEERWEAIEEAERSFRDTGVRLSSDNIGLARVRDGVELVRVGKPLRPEFAAWRYGSQFLRRRWSYAAGRGAQAGAMMVGLGGVMVYATTAALGPALLAAAVPALLWGGMARLRVGGRRDVVARVQGADGAMLALRRGELASVELVAQKADRWGIRIDTTELGTVHLVDAAAIRVAGLALAQRNDAGASKAQVRDAVAGLEGVGDTATLLRLLAKRGPMTYLDTKYRLALEMATHEESERRALEGELRDLELAWAEAEEIAAIADNMFLPAPVTDWLRRSKT